MATAFNAGPVACDEQSGVATRSIATSAWDGAACSRDLTNVRCQGPSGTFGSDSLAASHTHGFSGARPRTLESVWQSVHAAIARPEKLCGSVEMVPLVAALTSCVLVFAGVLKLGSAELVLSFDSLLGACEIYAAHMLVVVPATRQMSAAMAFFFAVLSVVSLTTIFSGSGTCGCFGVLAVPPTFSLCLDLMLLAGWVLAFGRLVGVSISRRWAGWLTVILALGGVLIVALSRSFGSLDVALISLTQ